MITKKGWDKLVLGRKNRRSLMSNLRNTFFAVAPGQRTVDSFGMTDDGTPNGSNDMSVNGNNTPVEFWIDPQPNIIFFPQAIHIAVLHNDQVRYDRFGQRPPLSNGVQFWAEVNGNKADLDDYLIKTNLDLMARGDTYDVQELDNNWLQKYNDFFSEYADEGFKLDGVRGDKLGVRIQDNLSGNRVTTMRIHVSGFSQTIVAA